MTNETKINPATSLHFNSQHLAYQWELDGMHAAGNQYIVTILDEGHALKSLVAKVNDALIAKEHGSGRDLAAYIAHSCNAYPRLVAALRELMLRCDGEEGVRADGSNIQTMAASALLNELGEL